MRRAHSQYTLHFRMKENHEKCSPTSTLHVGQVMSFTCCVFVYSKNKTTTRTQNVSHFTMKIYCNFIWPMALHICNCIRRHQFGAFTFIDVSMRTWLHQMRLGSIICARIISIREVAILVAEHNSQHVRPRMFPLAYRSIDLSQKNHLHHLF